MTKKELKKLIKDTPFLEEVEPHDGTISAPLIILGPNFYLTVTDDYPTKRFALLLMGLTVDRLGRVFKDNQRIVCVNGVKLTVQNFLASGVNTKGEYKFYGKPLFGCFSVQEFVDILRIDIEV